MKKSIKYLIITIAVLICTFTFAVGAFGENVILTENASIAVQCGPDDIATVEFIPQSSGPYVISSKGNVDTVGALFNEVGYSTSSVPMAEDDDGGQDRNFELVAILNAGEKYYIKTYVLDDGGEFEIFAKNMDTVSVSSPVTVTINANEANEWLCFRPATNGTYRIYSRSNGVDPLCIVYDQYGQQISYNDDGENDLEFTVGCRLSMGTLYYLNVSQFGNDEGTVTVYVQRHTDGWLLEDGVWTYYENGERSGRGWKLNGNSWCYLGNDGIALTNQWKQDSQGDVYLDDTGLMVVNSIIESGNETYYVDASGHCIRNKWIIPEGKRDWMYFGSDGKMAVSKWLTDSNGWCYVGADGCMVRNAWVKDGNEWCYLNSSGRITKNRWIQDSVGWCYVGSDGYCVKNRWMRDSHGWCYLDSSGRMVTNRWVQDSAGWCFVGSDGYAVTNCWKRDSVGWCYLNANGSMTKNEWVNDGGKWYYLDSNGYMVTGTVSINGTVYTFNSSGIWIG